MNHMRRSEREITDIDKILEIIDGCDCCRLGILDKEAEETYIVPMNFGYDYKDNHLTLYFHGATEGRKINLIKADNKVTFEMDKKHELVSTDIACKYSYMYQCVMGSARAVILSDMDDKIYGLTKIMSHYSDKEDWQFKAEMVDKVAVIKLDVDNISCKEH